MITFAQKSTVDEEYAQALTRVVLSIVALVVVLSSWLLTSAPTRMALVTSWAVFGYCLFAVAWAAVVKRYPGHFISRRATVIVGDLGMTTFGMYGLGDLGASFYPLYLWIIVGNGMRYGPRYLYAAMGTGGLFFCIVLASSDYWQHQLAMGIGLWLGLLILPLFYLTLIRRLHASNTQLAAELVKSEAATRAQVSLAAENSQLYRAAEQALADLKATQERLVRGETLRALGELSSGAAHHLNNLLAVVTGRTWLLLADPEIGRFRRPLEIILRASADGAEVVRRIQEFAHMKKTEAVHELVDLNQVAADVVEMTSVRWRDAARAKGVSIDVVCEPGAIPPVLGHAASLREMLTSLLFNAIDALPGGGRIAIRTWCAGESAFLSVADNGVGMSEDVCKRAQEPFFTTKGPKSTGLGLSVSGSIVKRHGGDLTIESAPGRGTTVTICLACAPGTPAAAAELPVGDAAKPLSILVLDDEDAVREVLGMLLEADGHRVRQAGLPSEALAQIAAAPDLDIVLTDLCMPQMTGWEVACTVKERWPGIIVGLVTGWGDTPAPSPTAAAAVDFIVAKPIDPAVVRACLESALRARRGSEAAVP